MKKIIVSLVLVLLTQACGSFTYKKALCNESNLENVAGLQGTYRLSLVDQDFEEIEAEFPVTWEGATGRYKVGDSEVNICRVGTKLLMESDKSLVENNNGSGQQWNVSEINVHAGPEGLMNLEITYLSLSKSALDNANIPYTIEESDLKQKIASKIKRVIDDGSEEEGDDVEIKTKVMRVDNSQVSEETFVSMLKRNPFRFALEQTGSKKSKRH